MTGEQCYRNNLENVAAWHRLTDFKKLENVEWFAKAEQHTGDYTDGVDIVYKWGDWFITRGIPWIIVTTDTTCTLYKEPFD